MGLPQRAEVASFLELSRSAVATNVATFRGATGRGAERGAESQADSASPRATQDTGLDGNRKLFAVLKGNAYGHGFEPMLSVLHPLVDGFCVISPGEALELREREREEGLPRRAALVIGAVSPEEAVLLAREQVDAVIADPRWQEHVEALRTARLPQPLKVHVHLDTGLGREGFTPRQLEDGQASFLLGARDVLAVSGVLSHFANTEDVTEQSYAKSQLAAFDEGAATLEKILGGVRLVRHMAASAASLVLPPARHDVLRVGIALYGLWPSAETRLSTRVVLGHVPSLVPVLSWRCPSQVVKWLPAGSFVGYGCTFRCSAPTRVAVLPVGYFDGYPRLLSGRAHALVNGRRCPVLGRVMMNHLIVDVTHAVSDERALVATLMGRDGEESLPVEQLATWADTIHYELVTRLGPHLARRLVD